MSIRDHKLRITVSLIAIAVLGLGIFKVIHFLNTGYTTPLTSIASKDTASLQSSKNPSPTASGSKDGNKSLTASDIQTDIPKPSSSSSLTPAQADQDEANTNAQIAQDSAQYAASMQAEEQAAQQKNQACQTELAAQLSAQTSIQQKMVTIGEEENNLPQTLKAQDLDGITESAFEEQLAQAMAPLQSQYQALQVQYNQTKTQYPTPDCN